MTELESWAAATADIVKRLEEAAPDRGDEWHLNLDQTLAQFYLRLVKGEKDFYLTMTSYEFGDAEHDEYLVSIKDLLK